MSLYTETILKAALAAGTDAAKAESMTLDELAVMAGVDAKKLPKEWDAAKEKAALAAYYAPAEIRGEVEAENGEWNIEVHHEYLGCFTVRTADHPDPPRVVDAEKRREIVAAATAARLAEDSRLRFKPPEGKAL